MRWRPPPVVWALVGVGLLTVVTIVGLGVRQLVQPPWLRQSRMKIGTATQVVHLAPAPGGVAVDLVVTPAQDWPGEVEVIRSSSDGSFGTGDGSLHSIVGTILFDEVTVDGRHPAATDQSYAPVPAHGRTPLHITGVVRPHPSLQVTRRAAWATTWIAGLDITGQTVSIDGNPRCDMPSGWIGSGQDMMRIVPCPPQRPLHLPLRDDAGHMVRVEY